MGMMTSISLDVMVCPGVRVSSSLIQWQNLMNNGVSMASQVGERRVPA